MGKIIHFPVKEQAVSNGYDNLARLIAVTTTLDSLNFYIESIRQMEEKGYLLDGEAEKLTEQGRKKRLEISRPDPQEPERVESAGVYSYTPEMGQAETGVPDGGTAFLLWQALFCGHAAQAERQGDHPGKSSMRKRDFCAPGNHRVGWYEYRVTKNAFAKLKEQYSISMERLLD